MKKDDVFMDKQRILDKVAADIERVGRTIVGVFPTEDEPTVSFAYTVGNTTKGLPELLLLGAHDVAPALNALSEQMIARGASYVDGDIVDIGWKCPVAIIEPADEAKNYMGVASAFFGHDHYRVLQVVCPDPGGRFPWDVGCERPYSHVHIMRRRES